jgi:hypothetical protein
VLDVLVHLRRNRHGRRRVLHVRVVPCQQLMSVIAPHGVAPNSPRHG